MKIDNGTAAARLAAHGLESRATQVRGNMTRQLANSAMERKDVIPLWFGEPDMPTPDFICKAATRAIESGDTFYTEGLGRPFLRDAIATYLARLHGIPLTSERVAVTVSGGNAINLAFQCILQEGDVVVTPTPAFPNLGSIAALHGADVRTVPMQFNDSGWQLDIERLLDASRDAKAILVNSPSNPTGWVQSTEEQRVLLETCRKRGTWILSDEVYSRLTFDAPAAPSFLEVADAEDRVLVINSFSKAWAMTGWRLGWLVLPPSLLPTLEKIFEFSISCAPSFSQRAAVAALVHGESFVRKSLDHYRQNLETIRRAFEDIDRIRFIPPTATFYAYFQIDGVSDNLDFAQQMIERAGVGLAPGATFDPTAKDWYRLCFALSSERLKNALQRLSRFLID